MMSLNYLSMRLNSVHNLTGNHIFLCLIYMHFRFMMSNSFSLLSFALIASEQNNYIRPELTINNQIEIVDGKLVYST